MNTQFILWSSILSIFFSFLVHAEKSLSFEPDHYISYDIKARNGHWQMVNLRDQFLEPTDFLVRGPIKYLNPTLKRHNNQVFEIKNKKLHYAAYEVFPESNYDINETVVVHNQFGSFTFDAFKPSRLLVPSIKSHIFKGKKDRKILENSDHYLCYDIKPELIVTEGGYLKDEFRGRSFDTLIAKRLCNPVAKRHDDKYFDIINDVETNHLMCFELSKKRIFRLLHFKNQFGFRFAAALNDEELCVPSTRIKIRKKCEDQVPDSAGICGGDCPVATDLCIYIPETNECGCAPEQPRFCEDNTPDPLGVCGGDCPDNLECIADLSSQSCYCKEPPNPCGLNADGQCGGDCLVASEICSFIPGTNECGCAPQEPLLCEDSIPDSTGICGGECPNNSICAPDSVNQKCFCRPVIESCGLNAEGLCGGDCLDPSQSCTFIIGADICACL